MKSVYDSCFTQLPHWHLNGARIQISEKAGSLASRLAGLQQENVKGGRETYTSASPNRHTYACSVTLTCTSLARLSLYPPVYLGTLTMLPSVVCRRPLGIRQGLNFNEHMWKHASCKCTHVTRKFKALYTANQTRNPALELI